MTILIRLPHYINKYAKKRVSNRSIWRITAVGICENIAHKKQTPNKGRKGVTCNININIYFLYYELQKTYIYIFIKICIYIHINMNLHAGKSKKIGMLQTWIPPFPIGEVNWWSIFSHFLPLLLWIATLGSKTGPSVKRRVKLWTFETETNIYIYIIHAWELGVYSLCITSLDFFFWGGGARFFTFFFPLPKPRAWSWESVLNAKGSRANHQHQPFFAVFTSWNRHVEQQRRFRRSSSNNWTLGKSTLMHQFSGSWSENSNGIHIPSCRFYELQKKRSKIWTWNGKCSLTYISLLTFIFQGRAVRI